MPTPAHFAFSFALLLFYLPAHAESTANKCTDGKNITYANMPCEKLGLKYVGPVKDSVIVVPAIQDPKKSLSKNSGKKHSEKDLDPEKDASGSGSIKPVSPLIEKLLQ